MRFCSACGGGLIASPGRFDCPCCGRRHFLNSKPCTGALVVQAGALLLVKRLREPFAGWWDIPGGFLEPGEHPTEGVKRELREETGLEIEPRDLVGIYMDTYGPEGEATLNMIYECQIVGGQERPGDDAGELGWFAVDQLPEDIAFASARQVLADWRNGQARRTAR